MRNSILFALFIILGLSACDKKESNYDEFAIVYAELRIAEREYGLTEDGKAARLQILQKYGLTVEAFEEKTEEIKKDYEKWLEFQKTLIKILDSIAE